MINTAAAEKLLSRMDTETLDLLLRCMSLIEAARPGRPEEDSMAAVFISADPARIGQIAAFMAALKKGA